MCDALLAHATQVSHSTKNAKAMTERLILCGVYIVPVRPEIIILNFWTYLNIPKIRKDLISVLLIVVKTAVAAKWWDPSVPTLSLWFTKIWGIFIMEKITDQLAI